VEQFAKIRRRVKRDPSYLQVSDWSIEGIIAETALLVQEFPSFSIHRRAEEAIIEALLQLLQAMKF
jgi:hypothetical protein